MEFVALFEASQYGYRVLHGWFGDIYGLETTFKRLVLFDVFSVFVNGCGSQLPSVPLAPARVSACWMRLLHLQPHPAPTRVCISSIKSTISPAAVVTSFKHRFEAIFELAPILGSRYQLADIKSEHAFPLRVPEYLPRRFSLASPSTIAVFPTPGSPISTGLFLFLRDRTWIIRRISSSRPMTGSSFPLRASSVRSLGKSFQRLVFLFRRLVGHSLGASDFGKNRVYSVLGYAVAFQNLRGCGSRASQGQ